MEKRYLKMHEVTTRNSENGSPIIEGYFARFDDVYDVAEGATESIARGAFTESIKGDVRALYNHNTDIVLGRTGAGTLTLKETDVGLWGSVTINEKDSQAMDAYQRIARGDISGCSFGFDIPADGQTTTIKDDGTIHWTITRVNPLYEVSPVAFPAYEATHIEARAKEANAIRARELEAWKIRTKERLHNGIKSPDASQEDK